MFIEERHNDIIKVLECNGRIMISEIQDKYNVSFDTARRDLRILEEKGLLKRTRGGALPLRKIGVGKPVNCSAKDYKEVYANYYAIALKAIEKLENDDVIYITGGTIGLFMAQNLPLNMSLTVVVNSIILAEELRMKENVRVIVTAGVMDQRGNFYDAFAIETLNQIRMDKCFFTSACISAEFGLSIQNSNGIEFFRLAMSNSNMVYGLYPTEKIGFESVLKICDVNEIDVLITDWDAPISELERIKERGVQVESVKKGDD